MPPFVASSCKLGQVIKAKMFLLEQGGRYRRWNVLQMPLVTTTGVNENSLYLLLGSMTLRTKRHCIKLEFDWLNLNIMSKKLVRNDNLGLNY